MVKIISIVDCRLAAQDDLNKLVATDYGELIDACLLYAIKPELIDAAEKVIGDRPFSCIAEQVVTAELTRLALEIEATHVLSLSAHERLLCDGRLDKSTLFQELTGLGQLRTVDFCGLASWQTRISTIDCLPELSSLDGCWLDNSATQPCQIETISISFEGDLQVREDLACKELLSRQSGNDSMPPGRMGALYDFIGDAVTAEVWFEQASNSAEATLEQQWFARYSLLQQQWRSNGLHHELFEEFSALFEFYPERAEPLLPMAEYLRISEKIDQALELLDLALDIPIPTDAGYFHNDVYKKYLFCERAECHALLGNDREVYNLSSRQLLIRGNHPLRPRLVELRDAAYSALNPVYPTNKKIRNQFLIIVPFYNAADYIQRCVDSIAAQTYLDYQVVFVDDMSEDGGLNNIDLSGLVSYRVIINQRKYDGLGNQARVMDAHPEPNDIAVLLDGDDLLAHPGVLTYLNRLYNDSDCWMTYGQYSAIGHLESKGEVRPTLEPEPLPSLFNGTGAPFYFPIHLRSNRVGLFQCIKQQSDNYQCLRDSDGEIMAHSGDIASTKAMMALAGHQHIKYVPDVLCHYNTGNPLSHHHIAPELQTENARILAGLDSLQAINDYRPLSQASNSKARLLLICLSGGDPKVITELAERGLLPNIAKLLPHRRPVAVQQGLANDSFWRAVFSGKMPGQHFMINRDTMRQGSYHYDNSQKDYWAGSVQPFWDEFAIAGGQVASLNVPELKGRSVPNITSLSEWLVHGQYWSPESQPAELLDELRLQFKTESFEKDHFEQKHFAKPKDYEMLGQKIDQRQEIKSSVYKTLLKRGNWDVFVCGFDSCHDYAHRFWHFHDAKHSEHQSLAIGDPIEHAYVALDKDIGELLEISADSPAAVISGLGFQNNPSLNTILPQILDRIERSYQQERHAVEEDLVEPHSPANKLFYQVRTNPSVGGVNLNLLGREAAGLVQAEQMQALIDRLKGDLLAIKNTQSGQPMLTSIVETAKHFSGPYLDRLPDLFLIWNPDTPRTTYQSDLIGEITFAPEIRDVLDFRSGDHDLTASIHYNDALAAGLMVDDNANCQDLAEAFTQFVKSSISRA